jgi:hypothetical protein
MVEDIDIERLVAPRSAGTEDMEPAEYEVYVRTRIAKAMGFREDTTNKAELSLVDSYYEIQLAVVNKLAEELREHDRSYETRPWFNIGRGVQGLSVVGNERSG